MHRKVHLRRSTNRIERVCGRRLADCVVCRWRTSDFVHRGCGVAAAAALHRVHRRKPVYLQRVAAAERIF